MQADAGDNLDLVQQGKAPEVSFGPLHSLGSGTMELRIDEVTDTYRVVYVAKFSGAVFVLDAFRIPDGGSRLPKNIKQKIRQRYEQTKRMNEQLSQQSSSHERHARRRVQRAIRERI